MARTAADIMDTDFSFVDCDTTVAEAEEYFQQDGINALPVLNPDRTIFGLLTPKNLVQFHQRPLNNPRAFHAWEICDTRPPQVAPTMPLADLVIAVLDAPSRKVLIVNDEQQLVGIISTDRLIRTNLGEGAPLEQLTRAAAPPDHG